MKKHGMSLYSRGCRCAVCRESRRIYAKKYRDLLKERRERHGLRMEKRPKTSEAKPLANRDVVGASRIDSDSSIELYRGRNYV